MGCLAASTAPTTEDGGNVVPLQAQTLLPFLGSNEAVHHSEWDLAFPQVIPGAERHSWKEGGVHIPGVKI